MIERFNFYDVYGYLLPGSALLLVLVCPFWLAAGFAPSIELSSAVVGSVVAYFAGHLLQLLSREALPSKKKKGDAYRLHSSIMLDDDDKTWEAGFRARLSRAIRDHLGLATGTDDERKVAFEACRQYLQAADIKSYAEQFQGLYALARGLCMASVLGAAFSAGWFVGAVANGSDGALFAAAVAVSTSVTLFVLWQPGSRWCFWLVAAAALSTGASLSAQYATSASTPIRMAAAVAVLSVAARYFYQANRFHTEQFAKNVYLAFYTKTAAVAEPVRIPRRK